VSGKSVSMISGIGGHGAIVAGHEWLKREGGDDRVLCKTIWS
jgi:hypothetical protein